MVEKLRLVPLYRAVLIERGNDYGAPIEAACQLSVDFQDYKCLIIGTLEPSKS